jgi:hypothetical protein
MRTEIRYTLAAGLAICLCGAIGSCSHQRSGDEPDRGKDTASPIKTETVSQLGLSEPDCTGVERWPTSMAVVYLKDAGLTDNDKLDIGKTRTVRLASEKTGPDLYRQVHDIVFTQKSGATLEVITMNDATNDECSGSGVQVYLVSKRLGRYAVQ